MTTQTMHQFILHRIADWEQLAQSATPGPWWKDDDAAPHYGDFGWYVSGCPAGETEDSPQGRADATFIARNDPAHALAQCLAYKSVVEDLIEYESEYRKAPSDFAAGRRHAAMLAATRVASIWSDHPDYRAEWSA